MSTLTLTNPFALGGSLRSSRTKYPITLARALKFAGVVPLDTAAVRAYMDEQLRARRSSWLRRTCVTVFASRIFGLAMVAAAMVLLVALVVSCFGALVSSLALLCGTGPGSETIMLWSIFAAAFVALLGFLFLSERLDGLRADFATWKRVPYRANDAPAWVQGIMALLAVSPGTKFYVHQLVQHEKVVDPVLEAICPVTGESRFLVVWDERDQPVLLPKAV